MHGVGRLSGGRFGTGARAEHPRVGASPLTGRACPRPSGPGAVPGGREGEAPPARPPFPRPCPVPDGPPAASGVPAATAPERSGRAAALIPFSRSRRRPGTLIVKVNVARSPSMSAAAAVRFSDRCSEAQRMGSGSVIVFDLPSFPHEEFEIAFPFGPGAVEAVEQCDPLRFPKASLSPKKCSRAFCGWLPI